MGSIATPQVEAGTSLSFTVIAQGEHLSGNVGNVFPDKPKLIIITSPQEFDAALRQATGDPPRLQQNPHPVEQARQIDYNRFFAILALYGEQGSAGYSVTVDQIVRIADQVRVHATFVRPGSGQLVSATITDPYHLVAVEKTSGSWGRKVQFELIDIDKVVAETTHTIP